MTARGVATLIIGITSAIMGRTFGLVELMIVGLTLCGVVVLGWIVVAVPRGRLTPARRLRPQRIGAGQTAHVDLRLEWRGALPSGVLRLRDGVAGTQGAELHATPLRPGQSRVATYRLPPGRRGVLVVGPLEVDRIDPFGLARRRVAWLDTSELLVHPEILELSPPPRPRATDLASPIESAVRELRGEDFHALRPYQQGDDLRRVHWRATARHDELMIRENDDTREGHTTVVADVRERTITPDAFERMLSATASVLVAAADRGDEVALVLTDGTGPFESMDRRGVQALLDVLARAERRAISSLGAAQQTLRTGTRAGTLVSFLGARDAEHPASLGTGFQSHVTFRFGGPNSADPLVVGSDFVDRWNAEIQRRSIRAGATR